jgi:hypothetical protein
MSISRSFTDDINGSVYVMVFATQDEAAAYVQPAGRSEIENAPSPEHRWRGGQWVIPGLTAEDLRVQTLMADQGRMDLLTRLRAATPAQIDSYVENNVTTLAQARAMFKAILKLVALDPRS